MLLNYPDSREKFYSIASLAKDFIYVAETYGRIIISELFVKDAQKTIKPTYVGGIGSFS